MILASDIIKTILDKSYKGISCILWDFKIYVLGLLLWLWAGAGAVRVQIGASSLLQRRPVHMAIASIRYTGHKDVIVYFRY